MKFFNVTNFLVLLCVVYMLNFVWSIYHLWYPDSCLAKGRKQNCLKSLLHEKKEIDWNVQIYSSDKQQFSKYSSSIVSSWKKVNFDELLTKEYNCTLPTSTINNGSLFIHVVVFPSGKNMENIKIYASAPITDYKIPVSYFQLVKDRSNLERQRENKLPTTHWRSKLGIHVMNENFMFDNQKIPGELMNLVKLTRNREYLPMLFLDELSFKKSDLVPLPKDASTMKLEIKYSPISVGKLRLWITLAQAMEMMKSLGFTDGDLDDVKGIFTDTSLSLLCLTVVVTVVHVLFDFLGFKNDISYWKKRKTMLGLSSHTVMYRCISTVIIFLYLFDQKTSLLILVPAGIGSLIEIWKVTKALKVNVRRSGWKFYVVFGQSSDVEKTTENFDQQAIKYLSYLAYPLCTAGAFYSLFYVPHKSWYSWLIQSLVNGVYAFGFLFMLPQLFINYKLKSVAHLPWKVFMYKAFNTFIDDVFAFIVTMPTSHRLACFRDDIVFFCYLYQLWLYPVDKSRVNEYGYAYEDKHEKKE